jgi:hypothetical protein
MLRGWVYRMTQHNLIHSLYCLLHIFLLHGWEEKQMAPWDTTIVEVDELISAMKLVTDDE